MTIVASNSLTVSNVNDGTITHTAWAYSADGTDRFTTVYPKPNLLNGTKVHDIFKGTGTANGGGTQRYTLDKNLKISDLKLSNYQQLIFEFDWKATGTNPSGYFLYQTQTYYKGTGITISPTNTSGHVKNTFYNLPVTTDISTFMNIRQDNIPTTVTVEISNIMMYIVDYSPWMPSQSEVKPIDYPTFRGEYSDNVIESSNDYKKYSWTTYKGQDSRNYKAWAWSADGSDRFTTVYPNLNLLINSSAKTKDGFFKNFDKVESDYGEVTIKGTNTWVSKNLWDGFSMKPRDLKPGDKYTMSMDVMFTSWNLPVGTTIAEFWIGQRYSASIDGSINLWKHICSIDLPKDPSNMLNQWKRITKTSTIPPYEDPAVNTESLFMTKFTGSSEGSFTVRVRKPKQEPGEIVTPWTPSESEYQDDWSNAVPKYIGYGGKNSQNPNDYDWEIGSGYTDAKTIVQQTQVTQLTQDLSGFKTTVSSTYLTTSNASNLYPTKDAVAGTYLNKTDATNLYPTKSTVTSQINQKATDITSSVQSWTNDKLTGYSTIQQTDSSITNAVASKADKTQITQLSDNINLRVSKGDVTSQINIEAGRTLIDTKQLLLNADTVKFSGSAFIPNSVIQNLSADKVTAGTLNAANVNVINLNAKSLTAGTIRGTNLSMNLDTGAVQFTKGYISGNNSKIRFDLDNSYLHSLNSGGSGFKISDGQFSFFDGLLGATPQYLGAIMLDVFSSDYSGIKVYGSKGASIQGGGNAITVGYSLFGNDKIGISGNTGVAGNLKVMGNLSVTGSKNAVHVTRDGTRATPAYETAESYLGDLGRNYTRENYEVWVEIDPLFSDTVNTDIAYEVFLQAYDNARFWVEDFKSDKFLVRSDKPMARFAWEIKAKRRGYENDRLVIQEGIDNKMLDKVHDEGVFKGDGENE